MGKAEQHGAVPAAVLPSRPASPSVTEAECLDLVLSLRRSMCPSLSFSLIENIHVSDRKLLLRVFKRFSIFAVGSKIGFRDRIRMNNSRSSQTIRSKASPLPPGSSVRRSPSQENMPDTTSPGKVQKSWSFNDRTRFRTSLRLKPRPPADGIYWTGVTGIVSVY